MPRRKSSRAAGSSAAVAPVRSIWSGTITFGLVSIPVNLLSAVQPRQTAMKLVDSAGHALGRQYRCSSDDRKLDQDDLVRGYETRSGKMVPISDDEFESVAPEMSADIELRSFVPLEQIPPMYFNRPYFLAPAGKSAKAYNLLAATMADTGLTGIGSFVMRGHEYLVAIVPDNGVLRADTLRYADELRSPKALGLPKRRKATARKVSQFVKDIEALKRRDLDPAELDDKEAEALATLAQSKRKEADRVVHRAQLEDADNLADAGAKVIDLMAVLRKTLSKDVVVSTAGSGPPVSLAEHRAKRRATASRAKRTASRKRSRR